MGMPVTIATSRPRALTLTVSPPRALAAIVIAGMAARFALALGREIQRYLPDEYLYGQIARSLAEGHGVRVLGLPSMTPALLQPLLTAPAWLAADPATAFRITQAINVIAMGLGAVVVYAIARQLRVAAWKAVAAAAVSIASPDLLYTGYVTADAIGSTLALLAILAGVRTLERPSVGRQTLFIALAGLATTARLQYAAIAIAGVTAAVLVERGRPTAVIRRHGLVAAVPAAAIGAVAIAGGLGRYASVTSFSLSADALRWIPTSAALLALAAGVIVVPGAVAWTVAQCLHPTDRARAGFAGLTATLLALLLVASALFATETGSNRFFERYLMLGIPLAAIAFCCWTDEARPRRGVALTVAAFLVVASARFPISGYSVGQGQADSPFLLCVGRIEDWLGIGNTSLVVALVTVGCAGLAVAATLGRIGANTALGLTAALLMLVSLGAHSADRRLSEQVASETLRSAPNWVDRAGADAALLVAPSGNDPTTAMLLALRNRSLTRIALLGPKATPFDGASRRLSFDGRGDVRLDGKAVTGWLLLDGTSTRVILTDARTIATGGDFALVKTRGRARLAVTIEGLTADGRLAHDGSVSLFATGRAGLCRRAALKFTVPRNGSPVRVTFGGETIEVAPGTPNTVQLRGASPRRTVIPFTIDGRAQSPGRSTTHPGLVQARLTTDTGVCRTGTG